MMVNYFKELLSRHRCKGWGCWKEMGRYAPLKRVMILLLARGSLNFSVISYTGSLTYPVANISVRNYNYYYSSIHFPDIFDDFGIHGQKLMSD